MRGLIEIRIKSKKKGRTKVLVFFKNGFAVEATKGKGRSTWDALILEKRNGILVRPTSVFFKTNFVLLTREQVESLCDTVANK